MKHELLILNKHLGYDLLGSLKEHLSSYKQIPVDESFYNKKKTEYLKLFYQAIKNPDEYNLTAFQRDKRLKIECIVDILKGSFLEDLFIELFSKTTKKNIYVNYDRDLIKTKSSREPDFCIKTKKADYFIEFKTLTFSKYGKNLPIKVSSVNDNIDIFLLSKETSQIFILKPHFIKTFPIGQYWNKDCYMIEKTELFNDNILSFSLLDPLNMKEIAKNYE